MTNDLSNDDLIAKNSYTSLSNRIFAGFIDFFITSVASFCANAILTVASSFLLKIPQTYLEFTKGMMPFIVIALYEVVYISSKLQATIGQSCRNIRLSTTNGKKITLLRAIFYRIIAPVLLVVVTELLMYFLNGASSYESAMRLLLLVVLILPYFFTKRKQLLYDLMSGVVALQIVDEKAKKKATTEL